MIRPAIPQIIPLLSDSDLNVRKASANALSKLSELGKAINFSELSFADVLVAEYQESIGPAIPQMITLLRSWKESDIFKAAANALSNLSEHGKTSNFPT